MVFRDADFTASFIEIMPVTVSCETPNKLAEFQTRNTLKNLRNYLGHIFSGFNLVVT
jgi:hypothetical protein